MIELTQSEADVLLANVRPIRDLWFRTAQGLTLNGFTDRGDSAIEHTVFFDQLIAKLSGERDLALDREEPLCRCPGSGAVGLDPGRIGSTCPSCGGWYPRDDNDRVPAHG